MPHFKRSLNDERDAAYSAAKVAPVGLAANLGRAVAGSRWPPTESRGVPGVDRARRALGALEPHSGEADQGSVLPRREDVGQLQLAVQSIDQKAADLRAGHVPFHPRST